MHPIIKSHPHFFITATDTDAGKTWVTQHLIQGLLDLGVAAQAIKPVACGSGADGSNEDVAQLMQVQQGSISELCCYHFQQAAAPMQAAAAEHRSLEREHLLAWCQQRMRQKCTLMEGIGGLMVPLAANYLVSDWLQDMPEVQVLLVVGAKLGCINHTLLTLQQLKQQERMPAYIILNDSKGGQQLTALHEAIKPYVDAQSQVILSAYQDTTALTSLASTLAQPMLVTKNQDNGHW